MLRALATALAVLALLFVPVHQAAAKNCTVGCACGNTCIDCSKTCHVGAGTSSSRSSGDVPVAAIAGLLAVGIAASVASLFYLDYPTACASVPQDQFCGSAVAFWSFLVVGLIASTVGLALLGASNSSDTSFSSEPVPGVVLMRF